MKTDIALQRDVIDELKWEPSVDASHIAVQANNGIVTLTGHITSYAERHRAEQATKRVYGVKAVVNGVEVKLPPDRQRPDEDIARAATAALRSNVLVPADRIKVTVNNNGWLTLEGEVEWHYQRRAAERAIRVLPGLVGVSNLTLVKPKVTPNAVKTRIEEALKRSAEMDARRISVEVKEGTVKLHGSVRSWAEEQEAERAAWAAPGVHVVESHLKVSP
jgi:osmotically-inducible protein OsmY